MDLIVVSCTDERDETVCKVMFEDDRYVVSIDIVSETLSFSPIRAYNLSRMSYFSF